MSDKLWRFSNLLSQGEYDFLVANPQPDINDDIDIARLRNSGFFDGVRETNGQDADDELAIQYTWGKNRRGVPSHLVRNAVFGVRRRNRIQLNKAKIITEGNVTISVTGESLDQSDMDVFLECINLCKEAGSFRASTSQRSFMGSLGMRCGGRAAEVLKSHIQRMHNYQIEIETANGDIFSTHMIMQYYINKKGLMVHLSKELIDILNRGTTWIDVRKRKALSTDLEKWMHCFVSSHKAEKPIYRSIEDLHNMTSSRLAIAKFKFELFKAMDCLEDKSVIKDWKPINGSKAICFTKK